MADRFDPRPSHIGLVMDGNRRWARGRGHRDTAIGHRVGAEHLRDALSWCDRWQVSDLSVYVLSADNIRRRGAAEIQHLMSLLEHLVPQAVESAGTWRLFISGDLSLVTPGSRQSLEQAVEDTRERTHHLVLAIGYDGRADIVKAMRSALTQGGHTDSWPEIADITAGLAGGPNKEIDLVIRTGNEVRISGFFPWQSANAEIYLSRKMWPAFSQADFVRALRFYAKARRRHAPHWSDRTTV